MNSWTIALKNKKYCVKLSLGLGFLIITLLLFSKFLLKIEQRNGTNLRDIFLEFLPALNCSIPIFTLIWFSFALTFWQIIKNPQLFLLFVWTYLLLCVSRIITIHFVALNPPKNIIELADPLTNAFYGGKFITKDLFYSGHTSTLFLMYFIVQKKWVKTFLLFAAIAVGIMVLIQHVHYTIDVVVAPFFAWLWYKLAKKIVE